MSGKLGKAAMYRLQRCRAVTRRAKQASETEISEAERALLLSACICMHECGGWSSHLLAHTLASIGLLEDCKS